jgi:peptide/nickel transport system substrate-binding protein
MSIGEPGDPTNWNPLAAGAAGDPVVQVVAAAVLPSAYVVGPDLAVSRNSALIASAARVSSAPQVVDYEINPRAVWSDGVPVSAADFVYTWEADSGRAGLRDSHGAAYTPASTAGYDQVASVREGAGGPRSVVVRFASADPDWRALFSPLLPAQIGRRVGFDRGFTDPVADLPSAGPFVVQSWRPGVGVVLVRNPAWWGKVAELSTVSVDELPDAAVGGASVEAGQLDAAQLDFTPGAAKALRSTPGLTVWSGGSGVYDDLVANTRSAPLSDVALRRAVMLSVDRSALAQLAGTEGDVGAAPVDNRAYLPDEVGYVDHASALGHGGLAAGEAVLAAAGYRGIGTALETRSGAAVRLHLVVDTTSALAGLEVTAVISACRALGVAVSTTVVAAGSGLGTLGASGWDLALVARRISAFPSAFAAEYTASSPADLSGFSAPAMTALVERVDRLPDGAARSAAVERLDELAWSDAVDLPLLFQPQLLVAQSRYAGFGPSAAPGGPAWDVGDWEIPAGS